MTPDRPDVLLHHSAGKPFELRSEDRARFLEKIEGKTVEVEGYAPESCGDRFFSSAGGDWQVCKLVTIPRRK